jgi:hypothetical protein
MPLKIIFIISYIITILFIYLFINKRLRYLTNKYINNIWVLYLHKNYLFVMSVILLFFIALTVLSSILILTLL